MTERLKAILIVNVKRLREQRRMTQEQLAEAIEKSPEAVSLFERGKTLPSLKTLERMAMALGVPASALIAEDGLPLAERRRDLLAQIGTALSDLSDDQLETTLRMLSVLREAFRRG